MEVLAAEVNVATQDAYQAMGAFMNSVDSANRSLNTLETVVNQSERKLNDLALALADAENHFLQTGKESDRLKMDQLRAAFDDTKAKTKAASMALIDVQLEMHLVGEEAKKTATIVSGANQTIVETTKKAAAESAAATVDGLKEQGRAITETQDKVKTLSAAWLAASDTFKATGSMEAAANMERYAEQLAATETELGNLRRAQELTINSLSKSTEPAEREAANLARAENQVAAAAERASRMTVQGSADTTAGLKENVSAVDHLGQGISGIGQAFNTMFAAMAGFGVVKQVLDAIDDRMEKIVEARRRLGEAEYKAVEGSEGVARALGLGQGKTGEDAAAALVAKFRQQAGGLDDKSASDLLARAQATGYDVRAGAGAGYDIASTVGLFAKRMSIDTEAAGKLFTILNASGARTNDQAEKVLAQLEQAFRNIAMANPTQGVSAAVRGTVDRIEQGVSVPQAIGGVAAAAAANPDVRRAASDAERLSRVAIGGADKQTVELARAAQAQGMITPGALQAAAAATASDPSIKDHADNIKSQNETIGRIRESIANKQTELLKSQREAQDAYVKFSDEQQKFEAQQAEEQKKLTDPRHRKERQQIAERMVEQSRSFAERATRYQESVIDRQTKDARTQQEIKDEQTRIGDAQKKIGDETVKDAQARQDKALIEAYNQLPLAQKEQVIWNATRGMSPQQAEEFIKKVGGTGAIQPLVKQVTGVGREAYERAAGAAGGASVDEFRRNQQLFTTGQVSARGQTQAAVDRASAETSGGGGAFANDIETVANADIDILKNQGYGDSGFFRGLWNDVSGPFVSREKGTRRYWGTAASESALRARRILLVLRDRFDKFIQTMTPEQYAKYKPRLDDLWNRFVAAENKATKEGVGASGGEILEAAQSVAKEIGAAFSEIQADIAKQGDKNIPNFDATGLQLPAQRNDARLGNDAFSPGTGPRADAGGLSGGGNGGGSAPLPATAGPLAAAGGAGATYNISVGTFVSGGGDVVDLPGRLGASDLNLS